MSSTAREHHRRLASPRFTLSAEVARVRDSIVDQYDPDRIILFGSAATGAAREDSDIDLLIIKRTRKPYFDRVLDVRRAIDSPRRLDVFVLTPREYERAIAEKRYLIVEEILPKGRIIYERPRARRRRSRAA